MDLSGTVFGQYNVIRQLGRGGMGEVYEAEHRDLRKRFALKLLRQDFTQNIESKRRFRLEAEVMAKLEHSHIVRVDNYGETNDRLWMQMELINGIDPGVVTLGDYTATRSGKIPAKEFIPIMEQILEGLAFAHNQGVVHRDLKPGNILLKRMADGGMQAKIADFGLARVIGEDFICQQAQISLTNPPTLSNEKTVLPNQTGKDYTDGTSTRALLGTWSYMSPEQKAGKPADARSDVYAVGVMCHRLLTGNEVGPQAVSEFGVDKRWDAFVKKALEPKPSKRHADGAELLAALKKVSRPRRWSLAWLVILLLPAVFILGVKFFPHSWPAAFAGDDRRINITNQPVAMAAQMGGEAEFTVGAASEAPLAYQWRFNGTNISGAEKSFLQLSKVTAVDAGGYSVVVANRYGSGTSTVAMLTIEMPVVVETISPFPSSGRILTNTLGMVFVPLGGSKLLLSRFETRVREFNEFRHARSMPVNRPSFRQSPNDPVVNVNWNEAQSFCEWLTTKEREAGRLDSNQAYRLPLLIEWCQAIPNYQPGNRYVWGDSFEQLTNGVGNVPRFASQSAHTFTLPAGSFPLNSKGFADLVGNAAEWLGDNEKMDDLRYAVGGAWDSKDDNEFRVTAPPQIPRNISREDIGFRCLLDLDAKKGAD